MHGGTEYETPHSSEEEIARTVEQPSRAAERTPEPVLEPGDEVVSGRVKWFDVVSNQFT